jgi:myosin heavy subunit
VSQPLYAESLLVKYRGKEQDDMPPHVYGIAEQAYQKILDKGANQSILVSGESGAGKTESVKIMMQYLAVVSKSDGGQNKVAAQVLASNPLLEAFGNARTSRNNNSSRFGKFIEIQFSRAYKMVGARIHVYLLEKSRVVQQTAGDDRHAGDSPPRPLPSRPSSHRTGPPPLLPYMAIEPTASPA